MTFDARGEYRPERDVRSHDELIAVLQRQPRRSVLYPLVAARRAGKTWALCALEFLLNGRQSHGDARYLDLGTLGANLPSTLPAKWLLLDEPRLAEEGKRGRSAREFLAWCKSQHDQGATILLAMSPAEWVTLLEAGLEDASLSKQDLRFLPPLTPAQAQGMARSDQAKLILAKVGDRWQKSPFLLELVFQTAHDLGARASDDIDELLHRVRDRSSAAEFYYFTAIFQNGLTESQRSTLQAIGDGSPVADDDADLLVRCNLVTLEGGYHAISDPVLAANLCPLRIHHISDLHFGPKLGDRVDVKDKDRLGDKIIGAFGAAKVVDSYLGRVRELAAMGRAPHLLVISGDIAEWATTDQYGQAREWLDKLLPFLAEHPRLRPTEPNVLIAGGNHDVDWVSTEGSAGTGARKRHIAFARAFDTVPRSKRTQLEEPPESREIVMARYPHLGLEIVLLGSAEFGGEDARDPVHKELFEMIGRLRESAMAQPDEERAAALRRTVSRIDPGIVHDRDLERLRETRFYQPVRVAVLHHPVSPLPMTEVARYAGLINAGEVKDTLVHKEFCLVLHGHAHSGWFGREQWPERHEDWTIRIAAAPSLGSREIQEHNGYNEIELARDVGPDPSDPPYQITVHRFVREGATWARKNTMVFRPGS